MEIIIPRPNDMHLHLRDGDAILSCFVPFSANVFQNVVVMPNLVPPITNVKMATEYRERILSKKPDASSFFTPWMTLYLSSSTTPETIHEAKACGFIIGVKFYPAGATTNSDFGLQEDHVVESMAATFDAMQQVDLPLLVHGESTNPQVDMFDREAVFIEKVLKPLVHRFPKLRVVMEHVTTREGVEFVRSSRDGVAATITVQHLMFNRNSLFTYAGKGGLRPHHYCLPVLKREEHRLALVEAATSGSTKFFAGTDSAPHPKKNKECSCGCAGCFTSPVALELYTQVFEKQGKLDQLAKFVSDNAAEFYRLPKSTSSLTLVKETQTVPNEIALSDGTVYIPFLAGEDIEWKLKQ